MKKMLLPPFFVGPAVIAALLVSIPFFSAYLATKVDDGVVSDTTRNKILDEIHSKWSLVSVDGFSDLSLLLKNDRIARIAVRRAIIQHSTNAPQEGLIIRVYSSDLTGTISRCSFVADLDNTGELQHIAKLHLQ